MGRGQLHSHSGDIELNVYCRRGNKINEFLCNYAERLSVWMANEYIVMCRNKCGRWVVEEELGCPLYDCTGCAGGSRRRAGRGEKERNGKDMAKCR